MADATAFYFAAIAAGMRDEDVHRAIELADGMANQLVLFKWASTVVFFSPQRLALRGNGTMIGHGESKLLAVLTGHVFLGEWNLSLKYRFVGNARLTRLWSEVDGFTLDLKEVTYL